MKTLASVVVLTMQLFLLHAAEGIEFYVAPNGSDDHPGSQSKPFATLERARDEIRTRKQQGSLAEPVTVFVRGGMYELSEPLVFGPEDSGTAKHSITYTAAPGALVVVSGGSRISGWQPGNEEIWTAKVPGVEEDQWYPRHLWVDGRRAVRSRGPNLSSETPFWRLTDAQLSEDLNRYTLTVEPNRLGPWSNPSDTEVVVIGEWEIVRKRLESLDAERHSVTLKPPHIENHRAIRPRRGMACYFENAPELLDEQGEWYLDRATGIVSYWPLPGEDMTVAEVIVPRLCRLVEFRGTAAEPVHNVHFRGIHFTYTDWPLPELGYFGVQACTHSRRSWEDLVRTWDPDSRCQIEPAIQYKYADNCTMTDCGIAHTGGSGLWLRQGCRENRIEGNAVYDTAGNGLMIGDHTWNFLYYRDPSFTVPPEDVPTGNVFANNHIHNCGVAFHGGVGIWLAFTDGAVVRHNLIHHLPYTGISVGWMWREKPNTVCRRNVIEANHVYDVMRLLADGGCIYTLGRQDGTVLRGNLLHDVHYSPVAQQSRRSNNGIFFDQGSMGFHIEGNVIYNTAGPPVRFNQCTQDWHTWEDNHFLPSQPRLAEGKIGSALGCDGRAFIEVPHDAKYEPEQLTAEAWIRLDRWPEPRTIAAGKTDTRRWIVSKNANEWEQGHYGLAIRHDQVGAYLNIGGGRENCFAAWSDEGLLTVERWYHLAMTYDGSQLKVCLDGRQVASETIGKERVPGGQPLAIGRRQDGYVYFTGRIDEVRLYSRALSESELRTHASKSMAIATPQHEAGLVGYWPFENAPDLDQIIHNMREAAGLKPPYRRKLLD
jgi:hypothetical protein